MKKNLIMVIATVALFPLQAINADQVTQLQSSKIVKQSGHLKKIKPPQLKRVPSKKIPLPARFQRVNVGKQMNFIFDNRTNLVWEDTVHTSKYTYRWYSKEREKQCIKSRKWNSAPCLDMMHPGKYGTAATQCKNMRRPRGYENWRLPTISELASIGMKNNKANHFLDNAFQYTAYGSYWSSSSIPNSTGNGASMVHRAILEKSRHSKSNKLYVRCVHNRL